MALWPAIIYEKNGVRVQCELKKNFTITYINSKDDIKKEYIMVIGKGGVSFKKVLVSTCSLEQLS